MKRRQVLLAALGAPAGCVLAGCRASLPPLASANVTAVGLALLGESAAAHGSGALAEVHDINVSYSGRWGRLVQKLQPELVDAGFRGGSQERLLLEHNLLAQSHTGPSGHKQVVRQLGGDEAGDIRVWFNGQDAHDDVRVHAAALVADAYSLFLLGPMLIDRYRVAGRDLALDVAPSEILDDGKRTQRCDVLRIQMRPGLGLSSGDQLALYIDQNTRLMRRVRFTLEGLESTRGALVDVDTLDFIRIGGIRWPTRFHEQLLRPLPLSVHDWRLMGLDLNRGYEAGDISGEAFTGRAASAAAPLDGRSSS